MEVLSHCCVQFFATPWTVVQQTPLFMEFSRQEYWRGLPFPPPGGLPDSRIEPRAPALAGGFFTTESPGKPPIAWYLNIYLVNVVIFHFN